MKFRHASFYLATDNGVCLLDGPGQSVEAELSTMTRSPLQDWMIRLESGFATASKQVLLVIPSDWVMSQQTSLPLVPTPELVRLASLALSSELSHLAPEQVCYRYQIRLQSEQMTEVEVFVVSLDLWSFIVERLSSGTRLVALITHVDYLNWLEHPREKTLTQLSLKPFSEHDRKRVPKWYGWYRCLMINLTLAMVCTTVLVMLQQSKHEALQVLQRQQQEQPSLDRVESYVPSPLIASMNSVLNELPETIRLDAYRQKKNLITITLTGREQNLNDVLEEWQQQWRSPAPKIQVTHRQLVQNGGIQRVAIEIKE